MSWQVDALRRRKKGSVTHILSAALNPAGGRWIHVDPATLAVSFPLVEENARGKFSRDLQLPGVFYIYLQIVGYNLIYSAFTLGS